MKMCEHCKGSEATQTKQNYGHFTFLCDSCADGEKTMTAEDMEKFGVQGIYKGSQEAIENVPPIKYLSEEESKKMDALLNNLQGGKADEPKKG